MIRYYGFRFQVSGYNLNHELSRAGLCARRFQIIAYYKIWSAQPATS
jgi:hypothetical protein